MPSLQVTTLTLGALDTNCYLIWEQSSGQAMIIDPADDGTSINDQILNLQLRPQAIVLTHGHFDHVLATLEVKTAFNIPILMHRGDQQLLARANASALHWTGASADPVPLADQFLVDEQILNIGKSTLKIMHTPGHTPGSICLYDREIIFTGDTLFKDGVGRTDFSYSNNKQLWQSITKIKSLGTKLAYPGHGEVFSI